MTDKVSLAEQADFYDQRWSLDALENRLNGFQLARAAAIFNALSMLDLQFKLRTIKQLRLCDLGCGRGWMAAQLASVGRVTGVDLSPGGIKLASERWPFIHFECADILSYQSEQPFDLIVSSEVIEHIQEKERFVQAVVRNIKPRGFAVITTPNARAKSAWAKVGQLSQPIEEWPSLSELRRLFSRDFEILSHDTFVHNYTYLGSHRIFSAPKLLRLLRRTRLLPAYQGAQSLLGVGLHQVLVARRR